MHAKSYFKTNKQTNKHKVNRVTMATKGGDHVMDTGFKKWMQWILLTPLLMGYGHYNKNTNTLLNFMDWSVVN